MTPLSTSADGAHRLATGERNHRGSQDVEPIFTRDWFNKNIPAWVQLLAEYRHAPNLKFLEVGVFEGRSTLWLLTHILTHPSSTITCIDTFGGFRDSPENMIHSFTDDDLQVMYPRFLHNIAPYRERVEINIGISQQLLRLLPLDSYHFIYLDGSHRSADVLEDAVLSSRLLKVGGVLILDDYDWDQNVGTANHPREGIDAFMRIYSQSFTTISLGRQAVLRKNL